MQTAVGDVTCHYAGFDACRRRAPAGFSGRRGLDQQVHHQAMHPETAQTATSCWLEMADGQRLYLRHWPVSDARGAVLIVHGLGEHSGRHERLAQWFNQRGYEVRSYDQRGHGKTPGRRGALRHVDDLLEDLATVYNDYANALPQPPLLLGHSMGAMVAARTVLDRRITPPALILSSPALRSWSSAGLMRLARVLSRIAPNLKLRNGLDIEKLSHDRAVGRAYKDDPLCHGWVTPRLADFIFREGAACIADAGAVAQPTLLLVAESDALVDPAGSRAFARRASSSKQLTTRFFASLYHELFNEAEPGRSQVLMQLGDWLGRHAPSRHS